ncbi:hypothetical protein SO802_015037 [Lithocarpus litseifolius]|uniref:Uncharacterized protein n=1 Tax=Lithocarpus litseifolius TaxID=425828 RepID=A0AAW2CT01_9ROSI
MFFFLVNLQISTLQSPTSVLLTSLTRQGYRRLMIFVHTDEQLRAAHIILGYDPISSSFQAPKYVIKMKDPQLQQINIVVPGFLASTPPEGTQKVELPFQRTVEEEATPSQPTPNEKPKVVELSDFEEDFKFFNQLQLPEPPIVDFNHLSPTQVSSVQKAPIILDAMVLQRKSKRSLLKLLESHAGGTVLKVAIQTKPPTPPPAQTSQPNPTDKKRKRDQKGKDVVEEGRGIPPKEPEPQKGAKVARTA